MTLGRPFGVFSAGAVLTAEGFERRDHFLPGRILVFRIPVGDDGDVVLPADQGDED